MGSEKIHRYLLGSQGHPSERNGNCRFFHLPSRGDFFLQIIIFGETICECLDSILSTLYDHFISSLRMFAIIFRSFFPLLICVLFWGAGSSTLFAQSQVSGTVFALEEDQAEPLNGANIQLLSMPDSSYVAGTASANDGRFQISNLDPGSYIIKTSFLGFSTQSDSLSLEDENVNGLEIRLQSGLLEMDEFQISARRPRVELRGDTTSFHANGYRTNRDASVQDLVTRMPGFIVEDGQIQAQGETINRVLLDGEEFFGDDATLVLQNLPAEIVEQIEVFDRDSEQAQFTGFRDGNTSRTLNIVTREGMNRGQFGRINSGYGTQDRYMSGGNYNYFNGTQRVSVIGMTNNLNQQNFSSQDLLGISEASGGGGRGRRGGAASNFRTGGQGGINSVHSTGINYNDRWNDSWRINASYFFNLTDNEQSLNRERLYLTGFSADQQYEEQTRSTGDNYNHRFDMRLEHTIDDRRSFIFTPSMNFQRNNSFRTVNGLTLDENSQLLNNIFQENQSDQSSYNINSMLLYRHRFETEGRTFSTNIRTNFSDQNGERYQFDETEFSNEPDNQIINDQQTETFTVGNSFTGNFSYTEPITDKTQFLVSYRPSLNNNESVQDVFRFDEATNSYSVIDTTLTNRYDNQLFTNRLRGSYRFGGEKVNTNVSLSWQHTGLSGAQTFPESVDISQTWQNLLPDASVQYRFGERSNIRLSYNTSTRTPSVRQLQDVIDNSDPQRFTTGNPDLNQQLDHRATIRLRNANPEKGSSTSGYLSMTLTENYIGNRTLVAQEDTELQGDVILPRGSRLISPDNIGNALSIYSNLNRSIPVDILQSNLSLNAGLGLNRRPSFIDDARNLTDTYRLNSRFMLSSNISDRVDFRVSYNANYNIVENSIRPELNNNYYAGRASTSFNLMPWKGLVLASDVNLQHYAGLGDDYNQTNVFWNGSIAYKFFDDESAEIRLTMFDILGQNDNINRTILEDYIEDYRSNVLSRYVFVSLRYNFNSF